MRAQSDLRAISARSRRDLDAISARSPHDLDAIWTRSRRDLRAISAHRWRPEVATIRVFRLDPLLDIKAEARDALVNPAQRELDLDLEV